jgi:hypothetical protein
MVAVFQTGEMQRFGELENAKKRYYFKLGTRTSRATWRPSVAVCQALQMEALEVQYTQTIP